MAIDLASKFSSYVDEQFVKESRLSLITNDNFTFPADAATAYYWQVSTGNMYDYARNGTDDESVTDGRWSRYGVIDKLNVGAVPLTLTRDRSFTFVIDKLDAMETKSVLSASTALARQIREKVIPEIETWTLGKMTAGAGFKPEEVELTSENIYEQIISANADMDDSEVPERGRVLVVTPSTLLLMKQNPDIFLASDVSEDMRLKGVISNLDGLTVMKVPTNRVPSNFGFMIVHPCATIAPVKLRDYTIHQNPVGISGSLVEGRVNYDAHVIQNKASGIFYQPVFTE